MADENATPENETNQPLPNGEDTQAAIGLISQYVKDLSFENPSAPAVYQWNSQPQIDIQFNIGTQQVADDVHESMLKIEVNAVHTEGTAFIVDLTYAGLFAIRNVPEDQVQAFMLAEAPRILFPFARRVIADCVRDGGFAPLLLEPIDFASMYMQQQAQMQGQVEAAGEPVGEA